MTTTTARTHAHTHTRTTRINLANGKHLRQRDVPNLNILVAPPVEQLHRAHLREGILGQHGVNRSRVFDLDFPVVRHVGLRIAPVVEGEGFEKGDGTVSLGDPSIVDDSRVGRLKCVWSRVRTTREIRGAARLGNVWVGVRAGRRPMGVSWSCERCG